MCLFLQFQMISADDLDLFGTQTVPDPRAHRVLRQDRCYVRVLPHAPRWPLATRRMHGDQVRAGNVAEDHAVQRTGAARPRLRWPFSAIRMVRLPTVRARAPIAATSSGRLAEQAVADTPCGSLQRAAGDPDSDRRELERQFGISSNTSTRAPPVPGKSPRLSARCESDSRACPPWVTWRHQFPIIGNSGTTEARWSTPCW